jgi:ERCC4-type nuclease
MEEPMATATILIVADDREQRSGVVESLQARPGVCVQIRRLPQGDYAIPNRLLIERKTLPDFAQSIVDGRLFRQAARMRASGPPCALILEGPATHPSGLGVSRPAMLGALVALSIIFGIPVIRTANADETAATLVFAATQLARRNRGAPPRPGPRPNSTRRRQLYLLQSLPGIGPQRADALLTRFGSLIAILRAHPKSLARVPGIGPITASRVVELLHAHTNP